MSVFLAPVMSDNQVIIMGFKDYNPTSQGPTRYATVLDSIHFQSVQVKL